jgi:curved DNA-binding protein CbpA
VATGRSRVAAATSADAQLLAEDVDLDLALRTELSDLHAKLDRLDHYTLLGIGRGTDKKGIKRAYYELAARYHPDRYFRKRLGSFKPRMEAVFSRLTLAHDTLAVAETRAEYDAYLDEQERVRTIEQVLAEAVAEAARAEENVQREARAGERAPGQAASAPEGSPQAADATRSSGPGLTPGERRPGSSGSSPRVIPTVDAAARREAFAKRLTGSRPASNPGIPAVTPPAQPPRQIMTTAAAMEALRLRYEQRVVRAKSTEARKYAERAQQALEANDIAGAASALRVASGLAPEDSELQRKAADAQLRADALLGETYRGQAAYEEKNGQWPEAARSWGRVCQLLPSDPYAHQRAAVAMVEGGLDAREAARFATRACQLDPQNAQNRVALGKAYLAGDMTLNARREFEAAAKLDPKDASIQDLLRGFAG